MYHCCCRIRNKPCLQTLPRKIAKSHIHKRCSVQMVHSISEITVYRRQIPFTMTSMLRH